MSIQLSHWADLGFIFWQLLPNWGKIVNHRKRLDQPVAAPDLREEGYTLIGGRLLPDGHRAAAQFMFEDSAGERMTLYIRQALNRQETAFLHAESTGLGIVYWVDNGLAYALTAMEDKAELIESATAVYRASNP